MSSEERVSVTHIGAVAHVCLERPTKKNGLDLPMFRALIAAAEQLAAISTVRAIVLSGRGGCFSAGLDFMSFMAGGQASQDELLGSRVLGANVAQRLAMVWREVPVPVIAAIDGVAFGGGLQLAAGADVRLAAPDAQLSVMEIKWGLIPDMGLTQTLMPCVRPDVLQELIWTGRVVGAEEALRIGLVTRVVPNPVAAALELAQTIASKNPGAIRATKALFLRARGLNQVEALALETELQVPLLGSPNQLEAVVANMSKRDPVFAD